MRPKQTIGKRLLKKWKRYNLVGIKHYNKDGKLAMGRTITKLGTFSDYFQMLRGVEHETTTSPLVKMMEEKKVIAEVIGKGGNANELEAKGIKLVNPLNSRHPSPDQ